MARNGKVTGIGGENCARSAPDLPAVGTFSKR